MNLESLVDLDKDVKAAVQAAMCSLPAGTWAMFFKSIMDLETQKFVSENDSEKARPFLAKMESLKQISFMFVETVSKKKVKNNC